MKPLACSICLLSLFIFTARAAETPKSGDWARKVDPRVLQFAVESTTGETDFLVVLSEQANVKGAARLRTKLEKGTYVYQKLTEVASRTQAPLLRSLDAQGIKYQSFWLTNMILLHGNPALIQQVAERPEVAHIYANPKVRFPGAIADLGPVPAAVETIEAGVAWIHAPDVWALGFTGQGIVIGGNDTGYRWTHQALKNQYRGWNGTVADHNYNWHDSIHSGGGVCGPDSAEPCDDAGHGTHTMGTMVGTDGGTNQIGVAPGAKWIACRNMDQGNGTPATYTECFQFFIAPTDSTGANPDPSKAPDVINNSWGCPPSEGCEALTLQTPLENVRSAGIIPIVSAGNAGSACSTVEDPPAIYEAAISIGASGRTNNVIASFSSRGPVTVDGSNRQKPNVTAPGVSIRSSYGDADDDYASLSGTSMAGPHTVGAVALILSAHNELIGDVDAVETLLEQSAVHLTSSTQTCTIPGTSIPNNTYGWGRIDALAAVTFGQATPTPTPGGSATPTPGGSVTPTPTPGGETPTPTPGGVAQAQNLSTRLLVGTGNNVGIGGFIVTGGQVQVLLRGIGPSLSGVGIANPLADPVLELHGPKGFVTVTNNNWKDTQETEIQATGIPPTNDFESAILATLDPGSYTAVMSGNEGGVGVGLVEIYTLTQGAGSKLGNISTRAFVSTGSDIMIAGFILGGGTDNDPIIVRGIGPSSGLNPALADPTLELRDGSGTLVRANNNWQDDPTQAALINAANLAPGSPAESAIAETLAPGAYTALLAGANNGTGLGLVEVYDNPATGPTPSPTPEGSATPTATPGGSVTPTPTIAPPTPTPTPGGGGTCNEAFDSVTAPGLPAGWVASNPDPGDGVLFITVTSPNDTAPNSAFIPDQDGISDKVLDSRPIAIQTAASVMTFRNNFNSEFSDGVFWDGSVLEVSTPSISGGDFLDITDSHVGGSITAGGYTGEISGDAENPLSGRMAWSGSSSGFITTTINMGPNLSGQTVTLRFRFGTDQAVAAPGWWVDSISISDATCQ